MVIVYYSYWYDYSSAYNPCIPLFEWSWWICRHISIRCFWVSRKNSMCVPRWKAVGPCDAFNIHSPALLVFLYHGFDLPIWFRQESAFKAISTWRTATIEGSVLSREGQGGASSAANEEEVRKQWKTSGKQLCALKSEHTFQIMSAEYQKYVYLVSCCLQTYHINTFSDSMWSYIVWR